MAFQLISAGLATAANQTGPGALATAAAIATGSVLGAAGGVPLLGRPVEVYNFTTTVPASTGNWHMLTRPGGGFITDMSGYLSYDFNAITQCGAGETSPFFIWQFNWYLDAAGQYLAYAEQWTQPASVAGTGLQGVGPIRAQYLEINVSTIGSAQPMTVTQFALSGTSRPYSGGAPDFRTSTGATPPGFSSMTLGANPGDGIVGGVTGAAGNLPANSTVLYVCGLYNGAVNIVILPVAALTGVTYTPMIFIPGIGLTQVGGAVAITTASESSLAMPRFPLVLRFVSTNGAAQSANFNVTATGRSF